MALKMLAVIAITCFSSLKYSSLYLKENERTLRDENIEIAFNVKGYLVPKYTNITPNVITLNINAISMEGRVKE